MINLKSLWNEELFIESSFVTFGAKITVSQGN